MRCVPGREQQRSRQPSPAGATANAGHAVKPYFPQEVPAHGALQRRRSLLDHTPPPHRAPGRGGRSRNVIIAGPGRVAMLAEGLLLDAQLFTLFAWAYAEWPRAQGQPFLLPLQSHAAQFDTYREQPWPRGQTEA